MKMKQKLMTKISLWLLFMSTLLTSFRAHATVLTGSVITYMTAVADVLNPILETISLLVTIVLGVTTTTLGVVTIILYCIKIKNQGKED